MSKFLSPFVNWGIVSLRLLSSMPNSFPLGYNDVASQATSHLTMEVSQGWDCDFDFLDEEFMDIIHDCYIDFLVPKTFKFASGEGGTEWEQVYVAYVKAVISRVDEWVADREEGVVGERLERLRLLKPRLQFLLRKEASHKMPLLRGLHNTTPLFCPRQYIDMSVELLGLEDIGIHVSPCFFFCSLSFRTIWSTMARSVS